MVKKPDKKDIHQIIQSYVEVLRKNQIPIWRIYLFGSYVTNTQHTDSDIDLAVFLDMEDIDRIKEDVELMRLSWDIDLNIEPHAFARTDFNETNPFIKEIIETGERII
jgi:uncharacterized protein